MCIIESWGTGIPRIYNRSKEYSLTELLFEEFVENIEQVFLACGKGVMFGQANVQERLVLYGTKQRRYLYKKNTITRARC